MKAIMLAAGLGRRLYGDDESQSPKALLRFDGKSLLRRNIEVLRRLGIDELVIVVGYRKEEVIAEAGSAGGEGLVRTIENPQFRGGPVISLWTAREDLAGGDSILFMDADVLYHPALMERLIRSPFEDCFLLDREIELGEDPVRLCIRDGVPVDFGKKVEGNFDLVGEWPGFLCFSPRIAARVAAATETYMVDGNTDATYEEAMRDVLVSEPPGTFGYEDITGLPWIEIDFPSDLMRAEKHTLPRILSMPSGLGEDGEKGESTQFGGTVSGS